MSNEMSKPIPISELTNMMGRNICKFLQVDSIESVDDWDLAVKRPHFRSDGSIREDTIPGKRFLFKRKGKTYGVRLDPITKAVKCKPDSIDRFFGFKPQEFHEIDDEAMIYELKKVIDSQGNLF